MANVNDDDAKKAAEEIEKVVDEANTEMDKIEKEENDDAEAADMVRESLASETQEELKDIEEDIDNIDRKVSDDQGLEKARKEL